jgi:hypothetical protein
MKFSRLEADVVVMSVVTRKTNVIRIQSASSLLSHASGLTTLTTIAQDLGELDT